MAAIDYSPPDPGLTVPGAFPQAPRFNGDRSSPSSPRTTAPGATPVNVEAPASLSDTELVGRLRTLFAQARDQRKPVIAQWRRNHRVMRNRTFTSAVPAWMPAPEVPEVRPIIASCVAWVTDQRPEFEMAPAAQPFSPFYSFYNSLAVDMKTAMNAAWTAYTWESEIEKVVWDGYQFDIGWIKVCWDPTLAGGLGDVSLKRIDPWTIYPDPSATSINDANYVIEARTMSLQELDRRFPGAAEKFQLNGYTEDIDTQPRTYSAASNVPRANPGAIAPNTDARYGLPGQSRMSVDDTTGVTLLECWLREHTTKKNDDGTMSVYDGWRCIAIAGPHILMNERADDILPFCRHPYVRYCPEDLGEMFGQSMVELLSPSQLAINRLLQALQLGVELTGNPPFVEDTRSGLQRTKITNKPGQRITVNAGGRAEWMTPPQLNPMMPELVKFYIGEMERISGLSSIARGMTPAGRNSTDTLDNVQESGFVRIRLSLRNLEFALREVGELVASMISEFYTQPRMVSIVGTNGSRTSSVFKSRHFYVPSEHGAIPMRFQLLVRAGSSMPTSRQARMAEADKLGAMGFIDRRAVLEAHDWPNAEIILERIAKAEAAGMFAAPGSRQRAQRDQ